MIDSDFGNYNIEFFLENRNVVRCIRTYKVYKGIYKPDRFSEFTNFLNKIFEVEKNAKIFFRLAG